MSGDHHGNEVECKCGYMECGLSSEFSHISTRKREEEIDVVVV